MSRSGGFARQRLRPPRRLCIPAVLFEVERTRDRQAADFRDYVAGTQASFGGRAFVVDLAHDEFPRHFSLTRRMHPVVRAFDPFHAHQVSGDRHGDVDRNGKADALRSCPDCHVDADQLAVDVQQRPAGIAWVDRR